MLRDLISKKNIPWKGFPLRTFFGSYAEKHMLYFMVMFYLWGAGVERSALCVLRCYLPLPPQPFPMWSYYSFWLLSATFLDTLVIPTGILRLFSKSFQEVVPQTHWTTTPPCSHFSTPQTFPRPMFTCLNTYTTCGQSTDMHIFLDLSQRWGLELLECLASFPLQTNSFKI